METKIWIETITEHLRHVKDIVSYGHVDFLEVEDINKVLDLLKTIEARFIQRSL